LSYSWKREYRIRKSTDFRLVQENGRKWRNKDLLFIYTSSSLTFSRVGLVVSKKVGCAVVRNQVKRWLREASRHNYCELIKGVDVVIIAFPSTAQSTFNILKKQIKDSFVGISKKSKQ